jgi:hypothetical protein
MNNLNGIKETFKKQKMKEIKANDNENGNHHEKSLKTIIIFLLQKIVTLICLTLRCES